MPARLLLGLTAPPASAVLEKSDPDAGWIAGWYKAKPYRDYEGDVIPSREEQCVRVERKRSTGTWTTDYVSPKEVCYQGVTHRWNIVNDAAVSDTYAIRLFVTRGHRAGTGFVGLCNTKAQCLAM